MESFLILKFGGDDDQIITYQDNEPLNAIYKYLEFYHGLTSSEVEVSIPDDIQSGARVVAKYNEEYINMKKEIATLKLTGVEIGSNYCYWLSRKSTTDDISKLVNIGSDKYLQGILGWVVGGYMYHIQKYKTPLQWDEYISNYRKWGSGNIKVFIDLVKKGIDCKLSIVSNNTCRITGTWQEKIQDYKDERDYTFPSPIYIY